MKITLDISVEEFESLLGNNAKSKIQNKKTSYALRDLNDIKVGDHIPVKLTGFGSFTATVHRVTDDEVLFIMDEYIALKPMIGLQKWLDTVVYDAFPEDLKRRVKYITIPSVGLMFGWEDELYKNNFSREYDEQLPLMKQRRYRVAYFNNNISSGWLRNRTKPDGLFDEHAFVNSSGDVSSGSTECLYGVRPVFELTRSQYSLLYAVNTMTVME